MFSNEIKYHNYTPGTALNYCRFEDFIKDDQGQIQGIEIFDRIQEKSYQVKAKIVINAAGVFGDQIREKANSELEKKITLARGEHVSLDMLSEQDENGLIFYNMF